MNRQPRPPKKAPGPARDDDGWLVSVPIEVRDLVVSSTARLYEAMRANEYFEGLGDRGPRVGDVAGLARMVQRLTNAAIMDKVWRKLRSHAEPMPGHDGLGRKFIWSCIFGRFVPLLESVGSAKQALSEMQERVLKLRDDLAMYGLEDFGPEWPDGPRSDVGSERLKNQLDHFAFSYALDPKPFLRRISQMYPGSGRRPGGQQGRHAAFIRSVGVFFEQELHQPLDELVARTYVSAFARQDDESRVVTATRSVRRQRSRLDGRKWSATLSPTTHKDLNPPGRRSTDRIGM